MVHFASNVPPNILIFAPGAFAVEQISYASRQRTLSLRHQRSTGDYGCAQEENNTTTEWPEPRATNCSVFTQTIGMASPFLLLVSFLRSRQHLSFFLVPIQNSSYRIRNGLGTTLIERLQLLTKLFVQVKPSVWETPKSLCFSLQSFITPTLIYTSYLQLSLYRFIINNK